MAAAALAAFVHVAAADAIGWRLSFDIQSGESSFEHVDLRFMTDDNPSHPDAKGFKGYLIDYATLTGTLNGRPVSGLDVGKYLPVGVIPKTTNDNLFSPLPPYVDANGLAFQAADSGEKYQLYSGPGGKLKANCCVRTLERVFVVENFKITDR